MTYRDGQRTAVYRWEEQVWKAYPACNRPLTLAECQALANRVWAEYRPGLRPPVVLDGRGRRSGCWDGINIKLPTGCRRVGYVLHEVAHSLLPLSDMHGHYFARLLLDLLARYADVPVREARSLGVNQRPRRVQFASATDGGLPKRKIGKRDISKVEALTRKARALRLELSKVEAEIREYRSGRKRAA